MLPKKQYVRILVRIWQIPKNQLIQKHATAHFYLFKMIFLQHIARGINSDIIIVNEKHYC